MVISTPEKILVFKISEYLETQKSGKKRFSILVIPAIIPTPINEKIFSMSSHSWPSAYTKDAVFVLDTFDMHINVDIIIASSLATRPFLKKKTLKKGMHENEAKRVYQWFSIIHTQTMWKTCHFSTQLRQIVIICGLLGDGMSVNFVTGGNNLHFTLYNNFLSKSYWLY